jgi:regulator of protease activity HflC (stomatin/prohibitin superfamily)
MLDKLLNAVTLIAWVLFFLILILYALRGYQRGGFAEGARSMTRGWIILILLITLSITLLSASLVFIEPQQVGVVISMLSRDGYREQPMRSGLHWIVPLAEQVVRYPIYWQNYTMSTEPYEGARVGNDAIAARTSDGQAVYLDSSIIYRIDPNEAIRVHIDFQDRYIEDFVRPVMRGILRTEVSQFTADEVNSSKRKNLENNLEELLREEFSRKGFVLDQFLLRNIAFSPQYSSALEQKQIAEQAQTQKEYEAEQMRKLAEGTRDKISLEAQGRAQAIKAEGQAEADVVLLKAQAEAEALRLLAAALQQNKDLLTLRYIDKIAPGIRVMLVPNNNPYILPLPDLNQDTGFGMGTPEGPIGETPTSLNPEITPALTVTPTPTLTPTPTPTP